MTGANQSVLVLSGEVRYDIRRRRDDVRIRGIGALACLVLLSSGHAAAAPVATLPPHAPPSVQAPTAILQERMLLPDLRMGSVQDIAHGGETIGLIASMADDTKGLWLYDTALGTFTLRYEAPAGFQLGSPVFCRGDCYWVQWKEGSTQGWDIMALRGDSDRIERLRTDTYEGSTLIPALTADGGFIYWYESDQPAQEQGTVMQLFQAGGQGGPAPLFSLQAAESGQGPAVSGNTLAVGRYDGDGEKWTAILFSLDTGEMLEQYDISGKPLDLQLSEAWMLWREGAASEAETGRIAALEENDQLYGQAPAWALQGRLVLLDRLTGTERVLDSDVERAALLPMGVTYVNASGLLYCHSFALGQPIRLSAAKDFLPLLAAEGEELLTVRRLWTGEEELYRPIVFNVEPLREGWPDLL